MNEDILKEEIAMLESNNRSMQEEMARTWEKHDKLQNNWNELKEWIETFKPSYQKNMIINEHFIMIRMSDLKTKMQEIESRK